MFRKTCSVIAHTAHPDNGHIPYSLTVVNKDGKELCQLCCYFDSTPVLDQIAAVVMFVRSGNERKMIETSNAFDHRPGFDDDPVMRELGKDNRSIERLIDEIIEQASTISVDLEEPGSVRTLRQSPCGRSFRGGAERETSSLSCSPR